MGRAVAENTPKSREIEADPIVAIGRLREVAALVAELEDGGGPN